MTGSISGSSPIMRHPVMRIKLIGTAAGFAIPVI